MAISNTIKVLVGMIVGVMILLTTLGTTASLVDTAAESVTQDARCNAADECVWNATGSPLSCQFNTTQTTQCNATGIHTAYTGASLFNTGGVVILVFIAAGLLLAVGLIWKFKVNK